VSDKPHKPSLIDIILSVAASAFGVQSAKNRERDFQQTSVIPYIVVGVIFVLLFIVLLVSIVRYIVPSA
jgi:uncharacterized membrane protein YidH (DUF202 family)